MQHSTEYTVDGQETVAAITMTVVVVNENPFSPALSAVPFLTLNDTGVDNGFLSRNDYKKHLDSEGAWVIKGGICGPQAQRAVPGGTGAKTVHLLRKQSPRVPALAIQEAPGGGTEDRQREKFPGSGQWATHWNSQTQAPGKAPEPWLGSASKPGDSQHLCIQHRLWGQADLG